MIKVRVLIFVVFNLFSWVKLHLPSSNVAIFSRSNYSSYTNYRVFNFRGSSYPRKFASCENLSTYLYINVV